MSWVSGIFETVKEAVKVISEAAAEAKLKADIQAAQSNVQSRATTFRQNGGETNKQAYVKALDEYLVLVAYNVRKLEAADQAAIESEIARLKASYQGTQAEKDVLFPLLDKVGSQVANETPQQRQLQVKIHDAIGEVERTQAEVQASEDRLDGFGNGQASNVAIADARISAQTDLEQDQGAYSVAVADLIGLELEFELTKVQPAGPNGAHTPEQWKQAGDAVKTRYGAAGEFASFIDKFAATKSGTQEVQGWLDKINNDPGSLNLTPAEQELAARDPVSLAFLKALGVKLDLNDTNLSPEMKEIAAEDPVLFGLLQISGVKIWTDGTPPEGAVPVSVGGTYLYITIGDNPKPLVVTAEMAGTFETGGATDLGTMLLPQLNLDRNATFMRLAPGADILRADHVDEQMTLLMGGDNPQTDEAIKMLGVNLPQFFSPNARAATWENAGYPLLEPVLRREFEALQIDEDGPMAWFFSSIGELMNQKGEGAPSEVHRLMLDLAMERVNEVGAQTPDAERYLVGDNEIFLGAFSNSVQIADQLPGAGMTPGGPVLYAPKVARWMFNSTGFQPLSRYTPGLLWGDIKKTGNTFLADAIVLEAKGRGESVAGFAMELDQSVTRGKTDRGADLQQEINKQQYLTFIEDPAEILQPYFDGFLSDSRIGHQITITSDTELRNLIGKALGLPVTNIEAANNLDYSVDWYVQGTVEWSVILTAYDMVKEEGGDTPTLTALPIVYTSKTHGVNNGALFIVIKPDGDDVVIDGTAARSGVMANGGERVSTGDSLSSWKFDDFKTFQEDNHYDDEGQIYIPRNFTMGDADGDGHADYEDRAAAITTAGERVEMGVGIAGAVLVFIPGTQALGLTLLATGVAMSAHRLYTMNEQGQSIGWSNPAARAEYMNLIGTGTVFLRIPTVAARTALAGKGWTKSAAFLDGTQKFLGVGATYFGFSQTVGQSANLIWNWGRMNWEERGHAMLMVAAGIQQMRFGAKDFNPRLGVHRMDAPSGPSRRMKEYIEQRTNQLWQAAGSKPGQVTTHKDAAWTKIKDEVIGKRAEALRDDAVAKHAAQQQGPQPPNTPQPPTDLKHYIPPATKEFDATITARQDAMWKEAGEPVGKKDDFRDSAEYAVFEEAALPQLSRSQQIWTGVTDIPARAGDVWRQYRAEGPYWRMNQHVNQRAGKLWKAAGSNRGQLSTFRDPAWKEIKEEVINKRADALHEKALAKNSSSNRQDSVDAARQEYDAKIQARQDAMWKDAGEPKGRKDDYRDSAERAVYSDEVLPTIRTNWADIKATFSDRKANPDPAYAQGLKDFLDVSAKVSKRVALGYGVVNGAALVVESAFYFGSQERRTGPELTPQNAEAEMDAFFDDPDRYLNDNYENAFFGIGIGDRGYNLNGHLLSFTKPDGTQVYFRRAPESLYNAYKEALEARGVDTSNGIFINDTINLADYPGFDPLASPPDRYFSIVDIEHEAEIGEYAYELWLVAGKPAGNETAPYWLQLENDFDAANGQGAYDAWVQAGRQTGGADAIWGEALTAYQPEIQVRATELWTAAGKPQGNGPLPVHLAQAESEYGDEIGALAYDAWVNGASKPGGTVYQHWTAAQTTFETDRRKPAFDRWLAAGMPGGEDNTAWTTARNEQVDELWALDGRPVDVQIEVRAPWRENVTQDVFMGDVDGEGIFRRWRGNLGIGPVEAWRPRLNGEFTFGYPYNQPNVSTIRFGLPSPTQGYGGGVRQQDTTIWFQLRIDGGAASHNRQQVYDLTSASTGAEWTIMDGRAYLAFGNRNRVRVDYAGTGKGANSSWKEDKTYLRVRETGFMELGLGIDLVKYAYGDEYFSANAYYELQLYAPDLRAQWNFRGDGDYTRGVQGMPPFFEIDPALQLSWTGVPQLADLPGEER